MSNNSIPDESIETNKIFIIDIGPNHRLIDVPKIEKHGLDFISSLGHKHSPVDQRRNKPARSQSKRRKLARRGK